MSAPLVVSLDPAWEDLGPEAAALSKVGARLVGLEDLPESQVGDVAGLLSEARTISGDDMRRFSDLRTSSEFATGYDAVDLDAARELGIDEDALADALDSGALAGAGLDVLSDEPPDPGNRLLDHPLTVITPHSAWYSDTAEAELRARAMGAVVDALGGSVPADPVAELR